jgi:metal-dependent HD superfamily phosphatase/phosphodiesterase
MKIRIEIDFESGVYQVEELVQDKYDDSRSLSN